MYQRDRKSLLLWMMPNSSLCTLELVIQFRNHESGRERTSEIICVSIKNNWLGALTFNLNSGSPCYIQGTVKRHLANAVREILQLNRSLRIRGL